MSENFWEKDIVSNEAKPEPQNFWEKDIVDTQPAKPVVQAPVVPQIVPPSTPVAPVVARKPDNLKNSFGDYALSAGKAYADPIALGHWQNQFNSSINQLADLVEEQNKDDQGLISDTMDSGIKWDKQARLAFRKSRLIQIQQDIKEAQAGAARNRIDNPNAAQQFLIGSENLAKIVIPSALAAVATAGASVPVQMAVAAGVGGLTFGATGYGQSLTDDLIRRAEQMGQASAAYQAPIGTTRDYTGMTQDNMDVIDPARMQQIMADKEFGSASELFKQPGYTNSTGNAFDYSAGKELNVSKIEDMQKIMANKGFVDDRGLNAIKVGAVDAGIGAAFSVLPGLAGNAVGKKILSQGAAVKPFSNLGTAIIGKHLAETQTLAGLGLAQTVANNYIKDRPLTEGAAQNVGSLMAYHYVPKIIKGAAFGSQYLGRSRPLTSEELNPGGVNVERTTEKPFDPKTALPGAEPPAPVVEPTPVAPEGPIVTPQATPAVEPAQPSPSSVFTPPAPTTPVQPAPVIPEGHVPPRPKTTDYTNNNSDIGDAVINWNKDVKEWDANYGMTHRADGSPLSQGSTAIPGSDAPSAPGQPATPTKPKFNVESTRTNGLISVTRIGEQSEGGNYYGIQGQTQYEGGDEYRIKQGSKVADLSKPDHADAVIDETLKDPNLTPEERTRLEEARGQGDIDYTLFDETPMADAARRLGLDAVKVIENQDMPRSPSSVFVLNNDAVEPIRTNFPGRAEMIDRSVHNARWADPANDYKVVPSIKVKGTDGKFYNPLGFPNGVASTGETMIAGYVYESPDGRTFGKLYPTEAEAKTALENTLNEKEAKFRSIAERQNDKDIRSNDEGWQKEFEKKQRLSGKPLPAFVPKPVVAKPKPAPVEAPKPASVEQTTTDVTKNEDYRKIYFEIKDATRVESRPDDPVEAKKWDAKYGKTHNEYGELLNGILHKETLAKYERQQNNPAPTSEDSPGVLYPQKLEPKSEDSPDVVAAKYPNPNVNLDKPLPMSWLENHYRERAAEEEGYAQQAIADGDPVFLGKQASDFHKLRAADFKARADAIRAADNAQAVRDSQGIARNIDRDENGNPVSYNPEYDEEDMPDETPAPAETTAVSPVETAKPAVEEPQGVKDARSQLAKLEASGAGESNQAAARRKYIAKWESENGVSTADQKAKAEVAPEVAPEPAPVETKPKRKRMPKPAPVAGEPPEVTAAKARQEANKLRAVDSRLLDQYENDQRLLNDQFDDPQFDITKVSDEARDEFLAKFDKLWGDNMQTDTQEKIAAYFGKMEEMKAHETASHGNIIKDIRSSISDNKIALPTLPAVYNAKGLESLAQFKNLFPLGTFRNPPGIDVKRAKRRDFDHIRDMKSRADDMISELAQSLAGKGWTQLDPTNVSNPMDVLIGLLNDASLGNPTIPEIPGLGSEVDTSNPRLYTPVEPAQGDNPFSIGEGESNEKSPVIRIAEQAMMDVEGKPLPTRDAVNLIVSAVGSSENERVKQSVQLLKEIAKSKIGGVEVKFVDLLVGSSQGITGGVYNKDAKVIEISIPGAIAQTTSGAKIPEILAHELVHYHTLDAIRYDTDYKNEVTNLLSYTKQWMENNGIKVTDYGMTNEREFLAEGMTNPQFRKLLKGIPALKGANSTLIPLTQTKLSVYNKLVKSIKDMFLRNGVNVDGTVLEDVINSYAYAKANMDENHISNLTSTSEGRDAIDWKNPKGNTMLKRIWAKNNGYSLPGENTLEGNIPQIGNEQPAPKNKLTTPNGEVANHKDADLASRGFISKYANKNLTPELRSKIRLEVWGNPDPEGDTQGSFELKFTIDGEKFNKNEDDNYVSKLEIEYDEEESSMNIDWIEVDNTYRGNKLSSIILAEALERARRAGIENFHAEVIDPKERPVRSLEGIVGKNNIQVSTEFSPAGVMDDFGFIDPETGDAVRKSNFVSGEIKQNKLLGAAGLSAASLQVASSLSTMDMIGIASAVVGSSDRVLPGLNPIVANMHLIAEDTGSSTALAVANMFGQRDGNTPAGATETYDSEVKANSRIFKGDLAKAFEPLAKLSEEQIQAKNETLAAAMSGEITLTGPDAEVVKRMKALADEIRAYGREAGVEIGYAEDYGMPHSIDVAKVMGDEEGFLADAEAAYRENNPLRIKKLTDQMAKINDKWNATGKITAEQMKVYEQLKTERDELATANPEIQAEEYLNGISFGSEGGDMTLGLILKGEATNTNNANFLKGRIFEPSARKILRSYFNNDPRHAWNGYINRMTKIAEFSRRFGHDGSKWAVMVKQMRKEGMTNRQITDVRNMVLDSLGALNPRPTAAHALANSLLGLSNMSKLKTTAGTIFLESQSNALAGNITDSVVAPVVMLHNFMAHVGELTPSQRATFKKYLGFELNTETGSMELARICGMIDAVGVHDILENSAHNIENASDIRGDTKMEKAARGISGATARLARSFGLEAAENSKRVTATRMAVNRLSQHVNELLNDNMLARAYEKANPGAINPFTVKNEARVRLRRAGISDVNSADFCKWWQEAIASEDFNQRIADRKDPMAAIARKAIRMEAGRTTVTTGRTNKIGGKENPLIGQDTFGGKASMSFLIYPGTFREQIFKPFAGDVRDAYRGYSTDGTNNTYYSKYERARMIFRSAGLAAMAATAAVWIAIRTWLNGDDDAVAKLEATHPLKKIQHDITYTGVTGGKSEFVSRAEKGQFIPVLDEAARLTRDLNVHDNASNTKERAVAKETTRSIAVPALEGLTSAYMPTPVAAVVNQVLARKEFRDAAVDLTAGEKQPTGHGVAPRPDVPKPPRPSKPSQ